MKRLFWPSAMPEAVTMDEFTEAVERVTGLEKRRRLIQEGNSVSPITRALRPGGLQLPNTDPVHKVSIIPRGLAALGYTLQRPEETAT